MRQTVVMYVIASMTLFGVLLCGVSEGKALTDRNINVILENAVFADLDGNERTLEEFRGKTVLIDIWETWCTPCLQSMPTFQRLMEDYPEDFIVLAVSPGHMDSPEQVRNFVNANDYDFEFVFGQQFTRDMQVSSIPYKIYVGPDGKYITSVIGSYGPQLDYEKTQEIIEDNK